MQRYRCCLLSALAISSVFMVPAWAKSSPEQIGALLKQEKLLQGEPTVVVTGSEVLVTCYKKDDSSTKDCKVDAILTAKSIFVHDADLTRVTVRFCDIRNSTSCSDVAVSIGDVTAFGAGVISKDQLLSGIKMSPVAVTPPAASTTTNSVASTNNSAQAPTTVSATTTSTTQTSPVTSAPPHGKIDTRAGSANTSKAAPVQFMKFPAYGLNLPYLKGWAGDQQQTNGSNILVRLQYKGTSDQSSIIDVRVYDATKVNAAGVAASEPEQIFSDPWRAAFMQRLPQEMRMAMQTSHSYSSEHPEHQGHYHRHHSHHGWHGGGWHDVTLAPVALAQDVKIGPARNIKASQKAYWAQAPMSPREYMRTVAFASPYYVYQINLLAPSDDSAVANRDLEMMLSAVSIATTKAGNAKSAR